jgi:ribonucleases P/MRP protein subunit RPP40
MPPLDAPSCYGSSKCFFTYGQMRHLNPRQLPEMRNPWAAFATQPYIHSVDLIIPDDECYALLNEKLLKNMVMPQFFRINISLAQILHGDFLTEYVKLGNVRTSSLS